ncbi:hypothetical protein L0F63_005879 [Massospora cicadina]|nr:hypothetical protein L0F63_005879 [Massospora cicadina]
MLRAWRTGREAWVLDGRLTLIVGLSGTVGSGLVVGTISLQLLIGGKPLLLTNETWCRVLGLVYCEEEEIHFKSGRCFAWRCAGHRGTLCLAMVCIAVHDIGATTCAQRPLLELDSVPISTRSSSHHKGQFHLTCLDCIVCACIGPTPSPHPLPFVSA